MKAHNGTTWPGALPATMLHGATLTGRSLPGARREGLGEGEGGLANSTRTAARSFAAGWVRLRERLQDWRARAQQRRQLARMDDRMLKDIGITRSDAHQEARKWFREA